MNVKDNKDITVTIGLDEKNVPVKMHWNADDGDGGKPEVKAMLLSLFDKESLDTLRIDLWTKEMQVNEMDRFMFQTLRGLADSYFKATRNQELASAMQQFVHYFGTETGIIPKEEKQ